MIHDLTTFDKQFDKYQFNMVDQLSNNNIDKISKQ